MFVANGFQLGRPLIAVVGDVNCEITEHHLSIWQVNPVEDRYLPRYVADSGSISEPNADPTNPPMCAGPQLNDVNVELAVRSRRAGEQHLHRLGQPLPQSLWSEHHQRRASAPNLAVEDQKRRPTKMVAVKM